MKEPSGRKVTDENRAILEILADGPADMEYILGEVKKRWPDLRAIAERPTLCALRKQGLVEKRRYYLGAPPGRKLCYWGITRLGAEVIRTFGYSLESIRLNFPKPHYIRRDAQVREIYAIARKDLAAREKSYSLVDGYWLRETFRWSYKGRLIPDMWLRATDGTLRDIYITIDSYLLSVHEIAGEIIKMRKPLLPGYLLLICPKDRFSDRFSDLFDSLIWALDNIHPRHRMTFGYQDMRACLIEDLRLARMDDFMSGGIFGTEWMDLNRKIYTLK